MGVGLSSSFGYNNGQLMTNLREIFYFNLKPLTNWYSGGFLQPQTRIFAEGTPTLLNHALTKHRDPLVAICKITDFLLGQSLQSLLNGFVLL